MHVCGCVVCATESPRHAIATKEFQRCVAVCCSALWWSALQCVAVWWQSHQSNASGALQCVVVCCSVLQCVVLQCVVVCCSALQCVAVSVDHTTRGGGVRWGEKSVTEGGVLVQFVTCVRIWDIGRSHATHETLMSHIWRSHVAHLNKKALDPKWKILNESCHTYETALGGDQTSNIWISRSIRFPDKYFEWWGLQVNPCLNIWGLPWRRVWLDMYRDSRENVLDILVVVIIWSPISSVRGFNSNCYTPTSTKSRNSHVSTSCGANSMWDFD